MGADARRRRPGDEGERGVPDGLVIGILAFLLGVTVLTWSATGLAGLFAKGAWPNDVTFTHTPLAMRHLMGEPHDLTGAWPETPAEQLTGYGLFWGLFIGQMMVLMVLTVFAMGTFARWRAVRARKREASLKARQQEEHEKDLAYEEEARAAAEQAYGRGESTRGRQRKRSPGRSERAAADGRSKTSGAPSLDKDATATSTNELPYDDAEFARRRAELARDRAAFELERAEAELARERAEFARQRAQAGEGTEEPANADQYAGKGTAPGQATAGGTAEVGPHPSEQPPGPSQAPGPSAAPNPPDTYGTSATYAPSPTPGTSTAPTTTAHPDPTSALSTTPDHNGLGTPPAPIAFPTPTASPLPSPRSPLILGPHATRRRAAVQAVQDAEGPALVVTSDPSLWAETKDARAKLGPVLVYDPAHLCDTPARLHWSPSRGCELRAVAAARAAALLAPVRPAARVDAAMADTAETLLRSFLHAAAVDGRQFKHVHRWAQGTGVQEAVRILRSHPKAASGAAGELEAALTAYPERRDMAQELTARCLSALFSVHIRETCTPNRADTVSLDSFGAEGGTLYVVGEPIEDPKTQPGAMPLLTALASSVVEHGRGAAARSSSGRLDPPMTLVLDDVAAVAPLPELPALLTGGAEQGLPTLALLRSQEQARARWPQAQLPF
ncbi:hypothetical protein [Streptomyces sp. NA04227]|uniref:hypothetical protein n=1 Tax=Streptomyces sp. NA04227 TaxID=2742136 RepID=UPI0020CA742B|nr:hypothetical protein [Streptomyces sp. NA04227]